MKLEVKSKDLIFFFIYLFLSAICWLLLSTSLRSNYSTQIGLICIICIVIAGIQLRSVNGKWFSLIYMFELSYCVLTLGQSILTGFGIPLGKINLYAREPVDEVNSAYIFSILCFIFMHLGIIIRLKRKNLNGEEEPLDYKPVMRNCGWIIFLISIIPYAYEFYRLISAFAVVGYRMAYVSISGTTSWSKMLSYIADFFPSSLFLLFIGYNESRSRKNIIALIIVLISVAHFTIGNRSEPICYLVALLWVYRSFSSTQKEKRMTSIATVIVFVIILLIVPIIGQTRNIGELTIHSIVDSVLGESSVFSIIFTTISDLGYSAFPTVKTMQLIPSRFPYHYGISYVFAFLALIPNLLGGTHISVKYAALAQWLMKVLNMGTGPGYSMPAEAYYNFGWFGMLIMPIWGYIIASILDERNIQNKPLRTFVAVAGFVVLFSIPRRDALTAIRNLVYNVWLIVFIVRIIARRTNDRG